MTDQNLSGSSFSGANSTGDLEQDAQRADEMVAKVLKVLEDQEAGNMVEPVDIEKGPLSFYCRECSTFEALPEDFDIENNYSSFVCTSCGKKDVSIGLAESLRSNYRLK